MTETTIKKRPKTESYQTEHEETAHPQYIETEKQWTTKEELHDNLMSAVINLANLNDNTSPWSEIELLKRQYAQQFLTTLPHKRVIELAENAYDKEEEMRKSRNVEINYRILQDYANSAQYPPEEDIMIQLLINDYHYPHE